jgi:putative ABC transport system permease protein
MISPRTLFLFYRRHLRVQPLRELMAIAGVAAGVALLFAVQINAASITGSFEQITRGLAGRASLEVSARGEEGFSEALGAQIAHEPGVEAIAPILEQQAILSGPRGSRSLLLVGATEELAALGGALAAQWQRASEGPRRGLLLMTKPSAAAIGARPGDEVTVKLGERSDRLALDATVAGGAIGGLAESPIAATSLPILQSISGMRGRLSRVLVEPRAGHARQVRRELQSLFGATLNVRSIDAEAKLLANAAGPETQLTTLFSAISILIGIILAYSALLLAGAERKRFIIYLIELGTPDSVIISSLAFDAFILGLAGSVGGLLVGDALSLIAYRALPGYITAAFPIGTQRVIEPRTVAIALAAGMLAAFIAAAIPAVGLLRAGAELEPAAGGRVLGSLRRSISGASLLFAIGSALIALGLSVGFLAPGLGVLAVLALAAGLLGCMPAAVHMLLRAGRALANHCADPSARLSIAELRNHRTRAISLFATGWATVFLVLAIGGSVGNVQRAVKRGAAQTLAGAALWIKPASTQDVYATQPFAYAGLERRIESLPEVSAVYVSRNSFLDLPNRRIWVVGEPLSMPRPIAASQLVHGSLRAAEARLREGGWALLSQTIAGERDLRIGSLFTLPTPSGPAKLRLAATISNYGWLPGTLIMSSSYYARLWRDPQATQLDVALKPGVPVAKGKALVESVLPAGAALAVQTGRERRAEVSSVLGSTLARLNDTTTIVLIVAVLAVIAMMIAAIWQRRGRIDALQSIGMSTGQLARLVFYEGGSMLLCGCLLGLLGGVGAQRLIDGWAEHATGSPIIFEPAWQLGLRTLLIALAITLVASVLAVMRMVHFQPTAAFSAE